MARAKKQRPQRTGSRRAERKEATIVGTRSRGTEVTAVIRDVAGGARADVSVAYETGAAAPRTVCINLPPGFTPQQATNQYDAAAEPLGEGHPTGIAGAMRGAFVNAVHCHLSEDMAAPRPPKEPGEK